jgi:hypothetical protein
MGHQRITDAFLLILLVSSVSLHDIRTGYVLSNLPRAESPVISDKDHTRVTRLVRTLMYHSSESVPSPPRLLECIRPYFLSGATDVTAGSHVKYCAEGRPTGRYNR